MAENDLMHCIKQERTSDDECLAANIKEETKVVRVKKELEEFDNITFDYKEIPCYNETIVKEEMIDIHEDPLKVEPTDPELDKNRLLPCERDKSVMVLTAQQVDEAKKLKERLSSQKPTRNQYFKCEVCNKSFSQKSTLQGHMRMHSSENPYVCTECGRAFTTGSRLRLHIRRKHTGEKPYVCPVCDKAFTCSTSLKSHKFMHDEVRPYVCSVCNKGFTQPGVLRMHLNTHTGERPYKCNVCTKTFTNSNCLSIHNRVHNSEKPYVCGVCGNAFKRAQYLKMHEISHSGVKPYVCNICSKSFSRLDRLKLHGRTHEKALSNHSK